MGIVDDDDDFLKLDNSDKQDLNNLENEPRLDPKAAADMEENSDKSEDQNPLESENKVILAKPAGYRQVRVDI